MRTCNRLGFVPARAVWTWPSAPTWGWLLVVAFCGTFSHYCMARAMLHADATIVVPMDFLRVPLTALAGWLLYAERMDLLAVFGAAMILGGNLLNLRSRARLREADHLPAALRSAALMRSCQPGPSARKYSRTS